MIIPSRTHYGSGKEGARRLHKAGKPKETQKKYREAEKWATDSGPQVVPRPEKLTPSLQTQDTPTVSR